MPPLKRPSLSDRLAEALGVGIFLYSHFHSSFHSTPNEVSEWTFSFTLVRGEVSLLFSPFKRRWPRGFDLTSVSYLLFRLLTLMTANSPPSLSDVIVYFF